MEQHLEPLAIAANITQAAHCRLDTVLLTFGSLIAQYKTMVGREDVVGCTAILESLEKCWLAADCQGHSHPKLSVTEGRTMLSNRAIQLHPKMILPCPLDRYHFLRSTN